MAKKKEDASLSEAQEAFELIEEVERHNRDAYREDVRFARLGEQWPEEVRRQREIEGRPCLTTNLMPAFIRQVVNEARQNKPEIQVHPQDSAADPQTADVISGLIRNIESVSSSDVAYDTAMDSTCSGGFGYWTVDTVYADDDSFDLDLRINAVADPLTIYGDPYDTGADSAEWNSAFETEMLDLEVFKRRFPDADAADWRDFAECSDGWAIEEDSTKRVRLAKWWKREQVLRTILMLSWGGDTEVVSEDVYAERKAEFDSVQAQIIGQRQVPSHRVSYQLLSGAEVLEERAWGGRYIPIIPVYGDVVMLEGKRHLRSMIRDAKDPQRMSNYWDTTATETVALAPKSPFIGPEEAFTGRDKAKWEQANTISYPYLAYKGSTPPQRSAPPAVPDAAMQMRSQAMDAMRRAIGLNDPSLGVSGDATSGKMLLAQQAKGDTSNFHFSDNVARAIRHTGRILIDLIPQVYSGPRVARVLGQDGKPSNVTLNQQHMAPQLGPNGQPMTGPDGQQMTVARLYDLTAGKYDLTVRAGPSFISQREEEANQMIEFAKMDPAIATTLLPIIAQNSDWHGADQIAQALQGAQQQKPDPQVQAQQEAQAKAQAMAADQQNRQNLASQQQQHEAQLAQQRLQQEGAQKQQAAQQEAALAVWKAQQQMALDRDTAAHELQMKRENLAADFALKREQIAARIPTTPTTGAEIEVGGSPG